MLTSSTCNQSNVLVGINEIYFVGINPTLFWLGSYECIPPDSAFWWILKKNSGYGFLIPFKEQEHVQSLRNYFILWKIFSIWSKRSWHDLLWVCLELKKEKLSLNVPTDIELIGSNAFTLPVLYFQQSYIYKFNKFFHRIYSVKGFIVQLTETDLLCTFSKHTRKLTYRNNLSMGHLGRPEVVFLQ